MANYSTKRGYQYRSLFWPVVLIGVGTIFLLNNMGILPGINLWNLGRLWPLVLIIIGLDLLFGHRSPQLGATIALGGVAIIVILMLVLPAPEVTAQRLEAPVADAESATVRLDLTEWPTEIRALDDSTNLLEAQTYYYDDVRLDVNAGDETTVELLTGGDTNVFGWFGAPVGTNERWSIGLTPNLPLALVIDGSSGSLDADLTALSLTRLGMDAGSGSVNLRLPAGETNYDANISSGSGSATIRVEAGASLDLTVDVGSGSFNVAVADETRATVRLSGSSGSITIDVPDDAAVRVEVADSGSGSVNIPGWLDQIRDGDDDEGLWESAGFADSDFQIDITVTDAGSGSINIQ